MEISSIDPIRIEVQAERSVHWIHGRKESRLPFLPNSRSSSSSNAHQAICPSKPLKFGINAFQCIAPSSFRSWHHEFGMKYDNTWSTLGPHWEYVAILDLVLACSVRPRTRMMAYLVECVLPHLLQVSVPPAPGCTDCVRSAEKSMTYPSTPLLMTSHDRDPSFADESIRTSTPHRP